MLPGADISHWNGDVNLDIAKANGLGFVSIKATEGHLRTDPFFHANRRKARAANLAHAFYHYFDPTRDASLQARHYLDVVGDDFSSIMPPALDLEEQGTMDPHDYVRSVAAWLEMVEANTRRKVLIYTYPWFTEAYLHNCFAGHFLWYARYTGDSRWPNAPYHWPVTIWQWSEYGSWEGLGHGNVDLNRFPGSAAEIIAL